MDAIIATAIIVVVLVLLFPVIVKFFCYIGEAIAPGIVDFMYYYKEAWKDSIAIIFNKQK